VNFKEGMDMVVDCGGEGSESSGVGKVSSGVGSVLVGAGGLRHVSQRLIQFSL